MEPIFVYITCKDRAEALQVGKALVEERLAACANVIDGMESIYWWKGQLEVGKEAVLILKSRNDLLEELTKKVKLEHSYEVPCVVALPIKGGNQDYLNWLLGETKKE
ncbi:divalent-cation tolerance protein CutA [Tolypothrix tenuis PCC 7101]|uniref:Divalent-cation tolerance protein CutA n=1 Tax=Tolypothrix tenuis PCC 7101 TaxID=231146 RepID=A0A1Z4N0U1_9CYAN|nr:divalent-cation tolerance protein CutA [Aulosira sp. FACHB-113]BAY99342.1 divalent-cation tolerance protein CutA [Tolypothrix tenuis PCC 7101]BAZ76736.1 divalent-cation tolerance protein CutA [Aulosira laxa NIES-50]